MQIFKPINYKILNDKFDEQENIKTKDDNKKWIIEDKIQLITLEIEAQTFSFISSLEIKTKNITKIKLELQDQDTKIVIDKQQLQDQSVIRTVSLSSKNKPKTQQKLKKQQTQTKNEQPIIYHIIAWQKFNQRRVERELFQYFTFKQDTPQSLIFKNIFLNWFQKLHHSKTQLFSDGTFKPKAFLNKVQYQQITVCLFQNLQQYKLVELKIMNIQGILNSFITPNFINLKYLYLSNGLINDINNMQALSFINAPKLKIVDLSQNKICCIKVLRKLSLKLEYLNLNFNKIQQLTELRCLQIIGDGLDLATFQRQLSIHFFIQAVKLDKKVGYKQQSGKFSFKIIEFDKTFPCINSSFIKKNKLSIKTRPFPLLQRQLTYISPNNPLVLFNI